MKSRNAVKGMVYLVGAGPGDPGLLTCKGLECIRHSDVLVYDRLVSDVLLKQAPKDAELIYVGKLPDRHMLKQEEINNLLAAKAKEGKVITRLKGGDPFVFGRGGEEAQLLKKQGVPFEIVPGVTSALAVPAYAGIPATHRGVTSLFTVITGHEDPEKLESAINWSNLAHNQGTLIFLMGMKNLPLITKKLLNEGMAADTPAAIIEKGTGARQRTLKGTLDDLALRADQEGYTNPAVIVIGKVVALREELQWFEKKPLFGKRIVVSRAREQASVFAAKLAALGAEVVEFPAIKIVEPLDYELFDRALSALASYQWIIFTSENGVKSFFNRLRDSGKDIRSMAGAKICAIGPQTERVLLKYGLKADYVPSEYRAEAIIELLRDEIKTKDRILLPRADLSRSVLPEALSALGAYVDNVTAYRTVFGDGDIPMLRKLLENNEVDMITFTSSSTVRNLLKMLLPGSPEKTVDQTAVRKLFQQVALAAIGPITATTARDYGLEIALEAAEYTIDGLVEAIGGYYEQREEK
jgi:uroporphyrinogen III methyltransferase / synthase